MEEEELLQSMESSIQSNVDMTVSEFKSVLADRLDNLTDKEKLSLLDMYGSEELQLIGKLLGPEITGTVKEQLNLMAEDAVLNPEGVEPVQETEPMYRRGPVEEEPMYRRGPVEDGPMYRRGPVEEEPQFRMR